MVCTDMTDNVISFCIFIITRSMRANIYTSLQGRVNREQTVQERKCSRGQTADKMVMRARGVERHTRSMRATR
jgi:hypothetical protein